jgi:hypothetical protein
VRIHSSIEPIGRLSTRETEISISFFELRAGASFRKRIVDRLYGQSHDHQLTEADRA